MVLHSPPPLSEIRGGGVPSPVLYKGSIPKTRTGHLLLPPMQQFGQAEKNGDASTVSQRLAAIADNNVLNAFISLISRGPRKLNYRRLEKERIIYFYFLFLYFLSAFLWYTFKINIENTCSLLQEKLA